MDFDVITDVLLETLGKINTEFPSVDLATTSSERTDILESVTGFDILHNILPAAALTETTLQPLLRSQQDEDDEA